MKVTLNRIKWFTYFHAIVSIPSIMRYGLVRAYYEFKTLRLRMENEAIKYYMKNPEATWFRKRKP